MPWLVAAPKLLFGRSLSAIAPSLFPYLTLALITFLSIAVIVISFIGARRSPQADSIDNSLVSKQSETQDAGWIKTGLFFVLLTGYGLLLKPAGFFISSFLVISATSLMLGNRNWLQILLLAILAPVCLYLIATRAMLVSLPELNIIELWYAAAMDSITGRVKP